MLQRVLGSVAASALMTMVIAMNAWSASTIDFEGLAEGMVINTLSSGSGISGDVVPGSVSVFGDSKDSGITDNAAIIFDSTCTGGCTGGDDDLFIPALGNTLIIAEDLVDTSPMDGLIDDPDDADRPGQNFQFDFSGFGPGMVRIDSVTVADVEGVETVGFIEVFSGGAGGILLAPGVPIPSIGNNNAIAIPVNVAGVDFMKITLLGSGAIDNIEITVDGICGDDTVDPPEECDGSDDAACPGKCSQDCMCPEEICGNNIVDQPTEQCDGTDDDACVSTVCRPDCTCAPVILNDPARIKWGRNGDLDVFKGFGVLQVEKSASLMGSAMQLKLVNGAGEIVYDGSIGAGDCQVSGRGKNCRYRNKAARDGSGYGMYKIALQPARRGYKVTWKVYGDFSNADTEMVVYFILNGEMHATAAEWTETRSGIKGRFPNDPN